MKRPMPPSRGWKPDPSLDLVLERVVDVPRELVWAAWTRPEHVNGSRRRRGRFRTARSICARAASSAP